MDNPPSLFIGSFCVTAVSAFLIVPQTSSSIFSTTTSTASLHIVDKGVSSCSTASPCSLVGRSSVLLSSWPVPLRRWPHTSPPSRRLSSSGPSVRPAPSPYPQLSCQSRVQLCSNPSRDRHDILRRVGLHCSKAWRVVGPHRVFALHHTCQSPGPRS